MENSSAQGSGRFCSFNRKKLIVRHFLETAFSCVNIKIKWEGKGLNEKGIDKNSGNVLVEINKQYYRPLEVHYLCGDSSKSKKKS